MIHTAPLDQSQVVESEFITESETYLYEQGYRTDTVGFHLAINQKPDSENSGYVVKTIETTAVPFEEADVIEDTITIHLCSCPAYRYQEGIRDLSERRTLEWDTCKHVEAVSKVAKAKADNQQAEL